MARKKDIHQMTLDSLMQQKKNDIIDADYKVFGVSRYEQEDVEEQQAGEERLAALSEYRYYDAVAIYTSKSFTSKALNDGRRLIEKGMVKLTYMQPSLFGQDLNSKYGKAFFDGVDARDRLFPIVITFSKNKVQQISCDCGNCDSWSYYYYYSDTQQKKCPYSAAAMTLLREYLTTHVIGDATDVFGENVINIYENRQFRQMRSQNAPGEGRLELQPRLIREEDGMLSVSFKVGESRLFVVRNMQEFYKAIRTGSDMTFGSKTVLNLAESNFKEESLGWLTYFKELMASEQEMKQRMYEVMHYYEEARTKKGNLPLNGSRLDDFYQALGSGTVEYEDKRNNVKENLSASVENPQLTMKLKLERPRKNGQVEGLRVRGNLPSLYYGKDGIYFILPKKICKVSEEYRNAMHPLLANAYENKIEFLVGRSRMTEFYTHVLPMIEDYVDIEEEHPQEIEQYLLPPAQYIFYLDAQEHNAFCRIAVKYGTRQYSVLQGIVNGREEPFRSATMEERAYEIAHKWFPEEDETTDELHCGQNEQRIYELMRDGIPELMAFGEVRCTDRFRNLNVVRKVKVSVGVGIDSGLMNLEISSEDVSRQELLDILKSYRQKKKYHILKSGEFVDIDDEGIAMLDDMLASMNIPLKEFVKGKMNIPMYRALYLDKLLEENEEIYSNRDKHFKSLIKNFKTVTDADFEEPQLLTPIMRKYQVNGYKWLRTLESYGFGGILADDMGLGKTLQVIAVLLAAKLDNSGKRALIVTPASLVYNWGSELERFAPQLCFELVTGTQKERSDMIAAYEDYDVLVTSYDLLKRDIDQYEDKSFDYQVIDEAQYIKNHNTAAAKSVKAIKSSVRFALTGTPIENRLSELWSIFDYLMPGFLFGYETFRTEFETAIVKNEDENATKRLQRMVKPFILRRLKNDVLKELPDKLEEAYYVKMNEEQQQVYDAQVVHMQQMLASKSEAEFERSHIQVLAELTRLRQLCCDPSLCFENYHGGSAKLDACIQLLNSAIEGGHKILLFSQFTTMLDIIERRLDEEKISHYVITGQTPKEQRMHLVKAFNEDETQVFLISLKAGGVGLNLTGADVVVHYDPWWNVAAQNQATDRAHRIGQTNTVTVYKMIAKHSIEEKIQKLQEAKQNLADKVLSGESTGLVGMTKEDFMELLNC